MLEVDAIKMLRNGTQTFHKELEETAVFSLLINSDVSVDNYRLALQVLNQIYSAVEPALLLSLKLNQVSYEYLPRLPLLRQDLAALSVTITPELERSSEINNLLNLPETLGVLYIVEGSTLGGQILLRHLKDKLGESVNNAFSFYTLDGNLTHQHWVKVQALLRTHLVTVDAVEQSIEMARKVFRLFIAHSLMIQTGHCDESVGHSQSRLDSGTFGLPII